MPLPVTPTERLRQNEQVLVGPEGLSGIHLWMLELKALREGQLNSQEYDDLEKDLALGWEFQSGSGVLDK